MALNSNDNNYLDFDYDNEKEQRAIYSLDNVDFNLTTRITRLEFTRKQKYRTIVKYVTRDYVTFRLLKYIECPLCSTRVSRRRFRGLSLQSRSYRILADTRQKSS